MLLPTVPDLTHVVETKEQCDQLHRDAHELVKTLELCAEAITALGSELDTSKKLIAEQKKIIEMSEKEIEELLEPEPLYKSPVLWGVVGIAAGLLVGVSVK